MDFISASLIGGMLYDFFKMGVTDYATCVNVALKDTLLTDEEKALITQDFAHSTEEDRSSKENLEHFFESRAPHTKKIVNNHTTTTNTQYQITQGNNGSVEIGDTQVAATTYVKKQTIYQTAQNVAKNSSPKKS